MTYSSNIHHNAMRNARESPSSALRELTCIVEYSEQKDARIQEYTRANGKVNYTRGRIRREGCRSNNFILLCKRKQQNENIIIINGTEVFGQMRKLWRLAERKAETYSCSRNGQSNRI